MWVNVKELAASVQSALKCVGYNRADIEVKVSTSVIMSSAGSDGRRAFVTAVNVITGERKHVNGSWGGTNAFNPTNPVDTDRNAYTLPDNGVVITGSTGHPTTYATVHAAPSLMGRMITSASPELTKEQKDALYCHACIKGGQYRRDELQRRKVQPATVDRLVQDGLLKENKAGSRQITTAGRNALGTHR